MCDQYIKKMLDNGATGQYAKESKKDWKEEIEEYGDLHNADCDVNYEGGSFDGCHCENMEMIKAFVEKTLDDRDRFWMECLEAHRKHCTAEGNKKLTQVKRAYLASKV